MDKVSEVDSLERIDMQLCKRHGDKFCRPCFLDRDNL